MVVPLIAAAGLAVTASAPPAGNAYAAETEPAAATTGFGVLPPTPASPQEIRTPEAEPPADPLAQRPPADIGEGFVILDEGPLSIPELVFYAYRATEMQLAIDSPECGLPWHLVAAVGRLESDHADHGRTDVLGTLSTARTAPNGALGPMSLPAAVWERFPADGNADGAADPQNIFDATLAAGAWMCADGGSVKDPEGQARAVALFDSSPEYLANVREWSTAYEQGARVAPAAPVAVPVPPTVAPAPVPAVPVPTNEAAAPAPAAEPEPVAPAAEPEPAADPAQLPELPDLPGLSELSCLLTGSCE